MSYERVRPPENCLRGDLDSYRRQSPRSLTAIPNDDIEPPGTGDDLGDDLVRVEWKEQVGGLMEAMVETALRSEETDEGD